MRNQEGFTLIEMMVAVVIAGVVMGSVLYTFRSQQSSYAVQEQVAMMQQNLRAAMDYMVGDIQMAGYRISSDINTYSMDWDPTSGGNETLRPLIYGRNNDNDGGGNDVRDGTDLILIVKASDDWGGLAGGEGNSGTPTFLTLFDLDLDGDGDDDLNDTGGKKYAILLKSDLSRSELIEISNITASGPGQQVSFSPGFGLTETYSGAGDSIARADIIIYKISEDANPQLERRNLGSDNGFQAMGEGISDMQITYTLNDGSVVSGLTTANQARVREVNITRTAETTIPAMGTKQRFLSSTIKVRNLGIDM